MNGESVDNGTSPLRLFFAAQINSQITIQNVENMGKESLITAAAAKRFNSKSRQESKQPNVPCSNEEKMV